MQSGQKLFFQPYPIDDPSLQLHGLGLREEMAPGYVDRPEGTGDYLFMFFHQPSYIGDVSGFRRHPADSLILWRPDDSHAYGRPDDRWAHSWIHLDGSAVQPMLRRAELPTNTVIPAEAALLESLLHELHAEATEADAPDACIAANLLENWLRRQARLLQTGTAELMAAATPRMRQLRGYMELHYHLPLRLADLAQVAGISAPHLSAEFRRAFGISPIEYLIRLRLQHARYLLRDRNLAIGAIARRVGYADVYYFSKLFRRRFGQSPSAMRQGFVSEGAR